jgi:hypothetical protein
MCGAYIVPSFPIQLVHSKKKALLRCTRGAYLVAVHAARFV